MVARSAGNDAARAGSLFSGHHDRRKVTDWVYEELKEAIVSLRLPPGQPLREAALAEQLGVSKTPIREALSRLQQEGLAAELVQVNVPDDATAVGPGQRSR